MIHLFATIYGDEYGFNDRDQTIRNRAASCDLAKG